MFCRLHCSRVLPLNGNRCMATIMKVSLVWAWVSGQSLWRIHNFRGIVWLCHRFMSIKLCWPIKKIKNASQKLFWVWWETAFNQERLFQRNSSCWISDFNIEMTWNKSREYFRLWFFTTCLLQVHSQSTKRANFNWYLNKQHKEIECKFHQNT